MSETYTRTCSRAAVVVLVALAGTSAGCALSTPGLEGFGLGGPKPSASAPPERKPAANTATGLAAQRPLGPLPGKRGTVVEVKDGDTLLAISQRYNVPVSVLVSENRLKDLNVFPGMRLVVPKI